MSNPKVAVHGACGRMGKLVAQGVHEASDLDLAAALDSGENPACGRDVGEVGGFGATGVTISSEWPGGIDVVIDFSVPQASVEIAKKCAEHDAAILVATTGLNRTQRETIIECHHTAPMIIASNTSLVVNVLMKLVREAGELLKDNDFDVEVVERHHRFKVDAPSGTALSFVKILEESMALSERRYGREGITGERPRHEIGIHSLRTGDNVGEHAVIFSTLGETMELVHKGHSRIAYVKGALAAARFLATKNPGLYSMAEVLGL